MSRHHGIRWNIRGADAEDILIRVRVTNRGPDAASLDVLPTIWFRNVWGWSPGAPKPELRRGAGAVPTIELDDPTYGRRWLFCHGDASLLFTDNETNRERLFGSPNPNPCVKADGLNVFQRGFLSLDNVRLFDRSQPLPSGIRLEQSDATRRMAMYSLNMLAIAVELAWHESAYEDVASKFWKHFVYIARAMTGAARPGREGHNLWHEEDGFFYDVVDFSDGRRLPLRIRVAR